MIAEAFSFLAPQRGMAKQRPGPLDDFWYGPAPATSTAGPAVTDRSALGVSAVYACVRVLAETIASLPLLVYSREDDDRKQRAPDHPAYAVLHSRPNVWQTSFEWREMGVGHICLRGNWYNRVVPGPRGGADQLVPLHPDRVTPSQLDSGRMLYEYRRPGLAPETLTQDEVFHVRGLSLDGVAGVSVLTWARNAIGLNIAQETHGAKLFANGSLPPFALEFPTVLGPDSINNFRAGWRGMHGGAENAHNPPILEGGMKIHELKISNEDSQWLESRRFQAEEIARFFRIPPHMIGLLDRATFSNIEQQAIEFVTGTIRPWCVRIEQALARDVIAEPDRFFSEFLLDGLLRGDQGTRYAAYNTGIQGGFLTRNEVRRWENLNPIPGGDQPLEPLNMVPAGSRSSAATAYAEESTAEQAAAFARARIYAAFAPLLDDAAERIAAAEVGGLRTRAEKAAGDRLKWRAWVAEFYGRHVEYAEKVLAPIAAAAQRAGIYSDRLSAVLAEIGRPDESILAPDADVPRLLAEIAQRYPSTLAADLKELLR